MKRPPVGPRDDELTDDGSWLWIVGLSALGWVAVLGAAWLGVWLIELARSIIG